jgi:aminopeptidase N
MEFCWLEDKKGADHFLFELFEAANAYFDECGNYVRPIVARRYDSSWTLFDNHLYPGGGWRIHMLRRLMGDSVFWAAIKDYVATYSYKLVETGKWRSKLLTLVDDFRKVLEKHSGLNLTQFFDQWFYGCGYPKLKGTFAWDAQKKEAKITLEQTQMNEKQSKLSYNKRIFTLYLSNNCRYWVVCYSN